VKQTATNIASHIPDPELARLGLERFGKGAGMKVAV
jgi:hypothetical protein